MPFNGRGTRSSLRLMCPWAWPGRQNQPAARTTENAGLFRRKRISVRGEWPSILVAKVQSGGPVSSFKNEVRSSDYCCALQHFADFQSFGFGQMREVQSVRRKVQVVQAADFFGWQVEHSVQFAPLGPMMLSFCCFFQIRL